MAGERILSLPSPGDTRPLPPPRPSAEPGERAFARYTRSAQGRIVAGVCSGLARHLGVEVRWVRIAFVLLVLAQGVGILTYAALWVFAPLGGDDLDGSEVAPGERGRVAGRRRRRFLTAELTQLLALAMIAGGLVLLLGGLGLGIPSAVAWPVVLAGIGLVVLWRQADDVQRARFRAATGHSRTGTVLRSVAGLGLVVAGIVAFLVRRQDPAALVGSLLSGGVVLLGVALIAGPFVVNLLGNLSEERAARIREQERAEIAAHVHDSVLHTLTLIQRHAEDPRQVARLARSQERELRAWLYRPVAEPELTFRGALERVAAEVEDAHGATVDVVVVGDMPTTETVGPLLLASREALVNAAKYAGESGISVYAEVEPAEVLVFVRDRGTGFDVDAVPPDRQGVRQSILGRMQRNGGHAAVRSQPGTGTEVELQMPIGKAGS